MVFVLPECCQRLSLCPLGVEVVRRQPRPKGVAEVDPVLVCDRKPCCVAVPAFVVGGLTEGSLVSKPESMGGPP